MLDRISTIVLSILNIFPSKVNKNKDIKLFLYKRNLEVLYFFPNRVFIKLDGNGEKFIYDVLASNNDFVKFQIPSTKLKFLDKILVNKHSPKNKFISQVWYNNIFEFEFINPIFWDHLQFSINFANENNIPIVLDLMFLHCIEKIKEFHPQEL